MRSSKGEGATTHCLAIESMKLCPLCGNMLLIEAHDSYRFFCHTCPYVHTIREPFAHTERLQRKELSDILGGPEAWKNAQKTAAHCDRCGNDMAFFKQMQTRSADEPMTIFFQCTNFDCSFRWKEG